MQRLSRFVLGGLAALSLTACGKVPIGSVGLRTDLGQVAKGGEISVLGPGRYWIGWNQDLFVFPTATQDRDWMQGAVAGGRDDRSITFQSADGLAVNADIGIAYHIAANRVYAVFQKYRKGPDEIANVDLRDMVQDALVRAASAEPIDRLYGADRGPLLEKVEAEVRERAQPLGISVERLYWVGALRLPAPVADAIAARIRSAALAQQRADAVAEAKAAADRRAAEADGEARATVSAAEAKAKSNRLLAESLNPQLFQYEALQKWDGKLPTVNGAGALPFLNITGETAK